MMRRYAIGLLLLLIPYLSFAQTAPVLPQVFMYSNLPNYALDVIGGCVAPTVCVTVKSGGSGVSPTYATLVQAFAGIATDAPNCNEIITVDAGYTSDSPGNGTNGPTYTTTCPTGKHVWVRSSNWALLPAQGSRYADGKPLHTSDKANMFTIAKSASASHFDHAFVVNDAASGLIVTGLDLELSGTNVQIGFLLGSQTNSSGFCNHIYLDRVYLDTTYATLVNHGVNNGCTYFSMSDSVIDHVNITHADSCNTYTESHDYISYNAPGPEKLVNNYFGGASTENMFWGGGIPGGVNIQPADIEVRRMILYKDQTQAPNASVKNTFEFKSGIRALVDGLVDQYSINDTSACGGQQFGIAIDFNPNGSGGCTWCTVRDITWTNNDTQHFSALMSVEGHFAHSGINGQWSGEARISFSNSLFRDENFTTYCPACGGSHSGLQFTTNGPDSSAADGGPYNVKMDHLGIYGSASNGAKFAYFNLTNCTTAGQWASRVVNWTFTNNAVVLDSTTANGDCTSHTDDLINGNVISQGLVVGGNLLFNFETSSGTVCSHWATFNPGTCPAGTASSPSTINSTLGIANYANCSAGSATPGSGDLTQCIITGANANVGPNIAAILAAQIEPNDSLKWGPRVTW